MNHSFIKKKKQTHFLLINGKRRERKIAICPVGLESLTTDLYLTSDDYLYHKKCFGKLNYKSAIPREEFSYYLPVNKLVMG